VSAAETYSTARKLAQRHGMGMALAWPPGLKADALMGYAHGLEEAAQELRRWAEAERVATGVASGAGAP